MAKLCEACGVENARGRGPFCRYCGMQPRKPSRPSLHPVPKGAPGSRWPLALTLLMFLAPIVAVLLRLESGMLH